MEEYNYYIKFDENNKFLGFGVQFLSAKNTDLPDNVFIITHEQHAKYIAADKDPLKSIVLDKGKVKIVNKYTALELAEQKVQQAKQALITEARTLLLANEFRWTNKIKWERYDEKTRAAIMVYYDALVAVINGESETIPVLEI